MYFKRSVLLTILILCGYLTTIDAGKSWHGGDHTSSRHHGSNSADRGGDGSQNRFQRMCQSEDPNRHECFVMTTENSSCLVLMPVGCDFSANGYCLAMRVEFVAKPCMIYKCTSTGCCNGWSEDDYGICSIYTNTPVLKCLNGGTKVDNSSGSCSCSVNFKGIRCETPICPDGCVNGGRCELENGEPTCICPSRSYSGERCEQVTCKPSCENGGICVPDGVLARCKCPQGYEGESCQYATNEKCPLWTGLERQGTRCDHNTKQCDKDEDCHGTNGSNTVCCYNGCTGICVEPEVTSCVHNGVTYQTGESFRPESCTVCVCQVTGVVHCTNITCPFKSCPVYQELVHVEDHCSKVCSGGDQDGGQMKEPEFVNCPTHFLTAEVGQSGNSGIVPDLKLIAKDANSVNLDVTYSRTKFAHSRSPNINKNIHVVTAYSDCDMYGRRAECLFKVIVKDPYPPVFTKCPAEIYALENDVITWRMPVASDNVGILSTIVDGDEVRNKRLKPGTYPVSYTVKDFDQNQAICAFLIRVFEPGLWKKPNDNRISPSKQASTLGKYLGCAVGICTALGLSTCILIRLRKRQFEDDNGTPRQDSTQSDTGSCNIYAICGPPNNFYANAMKLPAYSPPENPPSYDEVDLSGEMRNDKNLEPPIYEEVPSKMNEPHGYENVNSGLTNPTYVNDETAMKYMKI